MEAFQGETLLNQLRAFILSPLNQIIFLPMIGMLVVGLMPWKRGDARERRAVGLVALIFTLLPWIPIAGMISPRIASFLAQSGISLIDYRLRGFSAEYGLLENPRVIFTWIPRDASFFISYSLGVDGLSMVLVVLSAIVFTLATLASLQLIKKDLKRYFMLFLILQGAVYGVFFALDLILLYVFWELMLIPMYLLITYWGGKGARPAGLKFFIYTVFASIFMLFPIIIGILEVNLGAAATGYQTHILRFLNADPANNPTILLRDSVRLAMFLAYLFAFGVKIPIFPFHTWMPDAHTEAPAPMSMVLAAVLLKTGAYGLLRVAVPLFPDQMDKVAPYLGVVGVVMIIYGALVAFAQTDIKRIVAYSSLAQMGFITLGIASLNVVGFRGAIYMMFAHGIIAASLFWLVGIIEQRTGTRDIHELGGLLTKTPRLALSLIVAGFAAVGVPGLIAFWGEFPVVIGTFGYHAQWSDRVTMAGLSDKGLYILLGVLAALGVVFSAAYVLRLLLGVLWGKLTERTREVADLSWPEFAAFLPLIIMTVGYGLYPAPIFNLFVGFPVNTLTLMGEIAENIAKFGG